MSALYSRWGLFRHKLRLWRIRLGPEGRGRYLGLAALAYKLIDAIHGNHQPPFNPMACGGNRPWTRRERIAHTLLWIVSGTSEGRVYKLLRFMRERGR